MFPAKVDKRVLVNIKEAYQVEHICIDKNPKAEYWLLKTIESHGLTPEEVDKVYGYRLINLTNYVEQFIYLNEEDHLIMQELIGNRSEPCSSEV